MKSFTVDMIEVILADDKEASRLSDLAMQGKPVWLAVRIRGKVVEMAAIIEEVEAEVPMQDYTTISIEYVKIEEFE